MSGSGQENNMFKLIFLTFYLSFFFEANTQSSTGPIGSFIRTNFIGHPVIHDKVSWVFDPDVSIKRRRQFEELHGDKGEKLIERLGLGIDGKDQERLAEQRERDKGHLGGLNFYEDNLDSLN